MVRGFFVGDGNSKLSKLARTARFKQSGQIPRTVENPLYLNIALHDRVKNKISSVSDHLQSLRTIITGYALIRLSSQVITRRTQLTNERSSTSGVVASDKTGDLQQIVTGKSRK